MVESISLQDIWKLIKKVWIAVLAAAVAAGVLAAVYTTVFVPKMYTSSVTIYVSNAANSTTGNVNSGDLTASQLLANTSVYMLSMDPIRTEVCDELDADLTPAKLGSCVSIKQIEDTELLKISATTEDPELSADICNAYAKLVPEYLMSKHEAGSFKAIDEAKPADSASSPSIQKNILIGAFLGAFVCFGIYFVIFLFDNTVKDSDDLKRRFNVPVLGEIPSFSNGSKI